MTPMTARCIAVLGAVLALTLGGCVLDQVYVDSAARALQPAERAELLQPLRGDLPDYVYPVGSTAATLHTEYPDSTPRRMQFAPGRQRFTVGESKSQWYRCEFDLDLEAGHSYQPTDFTPRGLKVFGWNGNYQVTLTVESSAGAQKVIQLECVRPH